MKAQFSRFVCGSVALGIAALASASSAATPSPSTHAGRSTVYDNLDEDTLEAVSTPAAIMAMTGTNAAPTQIWSTLEHGEKVECLDCIPYVAKLLYASNAKTREISAWWLRRRIFGVFGPGEVYSQVISAIGDQSQSEATRAYAANALGEFLEAAGVAPVATALISDSSALVRGSAAKALDRLNSQGPNGELGTAMASETDETVKLALLSAAEHVNVFTGVDNVALLLSDSSAAVRRRAAEIIGTMHASDAVVGLIALTSPNNESDAGVRAAAVWSLGQLAGSITDAPTHDAALSAVVGAANDNDAFVRNASSIAQRSL
jgi:HEAT repeat protein